MKPYRIILADDHVLFRKGIVNILKNIKELQVTGEAGDGFELLELLKKEPPDMIIMDISMPNLRGLEMAWEIKKLHPHIRVLILTMHKDKEYVYAAVSSGAEGYLLKEDADTELFAAIQKIRSGGYYLSPLLSGTVAHDLIRSRNSGNVELPPEDLTLREREVLTLIADGMSNREIADRLYISSRTVEHHRANIMRKLNIRQTANLVKYAIQKGYISPEQ